jgi:hypothetical protein
MTHQNVPNWAALPWFLTAFSGPNSHSLAQHRATGSVCLDVLHEDDAHFGGSGPQLTHSLLGGGRKPQAFCGFFGQAGQASDI